MEIDLLQKSYDDLKTQIKGLKEKIKKVEKQASDEGFFVKKGKFIPNNKKLIAYWEGSFYSHFDGHTSDPICDIFAGSSIATKEIIDIFPQIISLLKEGLSWKEICSKLEIEEFIVDHCPYQLLDGIIENSENFLIKCLNDGFTLIYKGNSNQSELEDDSCLEVKFAYESEMIKCYEEEQRG